MQNDKLKNVFVKVLGISPEMEVCSIVQKDLSSWDSLTHVKLIMELEKTFSVEFEMKDFEQLDSFDSILKVIQEKQG